MSYENFPVAVVDNGGQWTHREYRVLNYLGCRAEIVSNVTPIDKLERFKALLFYNEKIFISQFINNFFF